MTNPQTDQLSREDRLAAALASCLEALDNGAPLDHAALVARYPEFASEIARFLDDQEQVECRAAPLRRIAGVAPAAEPGEVVSANKELGDFRIVREVGRGGMGVVYEAEQISLRRRVALKVLPFAATMDPRHLQRFHNEAQAAACLHHTNIVPVFFVGCERAVHFYAMQFIDGQPLSDLIRHLQRAEKKGQPKDGEITVVYQPSDEESAATPLPAAELTPWTGEDRRSRDYFRKVAELGIQAAEALDHAHQLGIVHRDIKPANLLLDGRGNVWVTDFGLAHMQHGEASLTATGQAVGTPRYMSPEQALAKRVPIDHRTDVYSLGVTLYELLTLRSAFASEDRQELLRQIAHEEPVRPRRWERTIPAELEIIVLKAMEKRPQNRYATAQELADDLVRWLKHEPIRARRPSWVQMARKWAWRHQTAVWASAILLFVVAVFGGGVGLWWLQKRAGAAGEARAAIEDAKQLQQNEQWLEGLRALRRAKGALAGTWPDPRLRRQIKQLERDLEMAHLLEEVRLHGVTSRTIVLRFGYHTQSAFDYRNSLTLAGWTHAVDHGFNPAALSKCYGDAFNWYDPELFFLDPQKAGERIQSRSIHRQLVEALQDWSYAVRQGGSAMGERWMLAVARSADPDPWRNWLRDVLERGDARTLEGLAASAPSDDLPPATAVMLARLVQGTKAAEQTLDVLRRVRQRHQGDFWINYSLAVYLSRLGSSHQEEALRYYTAAVALKPWSAKPHLALGDALAKKGLLDEAIAEFRDTIRILNDDAKHLRLEGNRTYMDVEQNGVKETAEVIMVGYAEAHARLAKTLRQKGLLDEAQRIEAPSAYFYLCEGSTLIDRGDLDGAIVALQEAIRLRKDDAEAHNILGVALARKSQLDEAIAAYREAIRLQKDYALAHSNLAEILQMQGRFREALEEFRISHEIASRRRGWRMRPPSMQRLRSAEQLVDFDTRLPALVKGQEQPKDADERLALALFCQLHKKLFAISARWYSEAFAKEPKLADNLNSHRYNAACAAALAGCGQGKDADKLDANERARLRQQALDWLRADLKVCHRRIDKSTAKDGPMIAQVMQHWLKDEDFAGVRGDNALAKLPEAERAAWRKLWTDVAELLAKAQGKAAAEKKPDMK